MRNAPSRSSGSAKAGTPDGSVNSPPYAGSARRSAGIQSCGLVAITRPLEVTSARSSLPPSTRSTVARAQLPVVLVHETSQVRLDRARGGDRHRERVRVHGAHPAREVDHAEQAAGVGVVHRRGRARPRLHDLVEVLGGEHLDRVVGGERGADRVGPRAALAPQRADGEVHRVRGGEPDLGRALEPQQRPVGIADHHQVRRVVGDPGEALADQRRHRHQRMDLPARRGLVVVGDRGRGAVRARIDAGRRRAPPRVGDRPTDGLRAIASEESLPGMANLPRSPRRRSRGVDGQPGIPQSCPRGPIVGFGALPR